MKKFIFVAVALALILAIAAPAVAAGTCPPEYVVLPGDSLSKIAARFGIPLSLILQMNNFTNPNLIHAGDKVNLPCGTGGPTTVVQNSPPIPAPVPVPTQQSFQTMDRRLTLDGVYRTVDLYPRSAMDIKFDNTGIVTIMLKNNGRNVTFKVLSPSSAPRAVGIGSVCKSQDGGCSLIWQGGGPEQGKWSVIIENWEPYPSQVSIGASGKVPSCGEGTERKGLWEHLPGQKPDDPLIYWVMCYPK